MALPETPYTRGEMYLNAIATGDTSKMPSEPYTRKEQYLDYIAKNGGGSGGGVLVVNVDDETRTLDKTWQEIADAKYAVLAFEEDGKTDISPLWYFHRDGANYKVAFIQFTPMLSEPLQLEAWQMLFVTDSADGYPVTPQEE